MKTTKTWGPLVNEMTVGLVEDDAAAVEAMALTLVGMIAFPTVDESRFALAFCRDKFVSERSAA